MAEDALEALEPAAASALNTAVAVSTPDVPSIMERMVKLNSEKAGKELDISELARRFENLEYQVRLPALQFKTYKILLRLCL